MPLRGVIDGKLCPVSVLRAPETGKLSDPGSSSAELSLPLRCYTVCYIACYCRRKSVPFFLVNASDKCSINGLR